MPQHAEQFEFKIRIRFLISLLFSIQESRHHKQWPSGNLPPMPTLYLSKDYPACTPLIKGYPLLHTR